MFSHGLNTDKTRMRDCLIPCSIRVSSVAYKVCAGANIAPVGSSSYLEIEAFWPGVFNVMAPPVANWRHALRTALTEGSALA
jgi:hypothetical protein